MALNNTKKTYIATSKSPSSFAKMVFDDLNTLEGRVSALDGAGEVELTMLESADTAGKIIVANASKVPTYVTMSGDVTNNSSGVTAIGANKVLAGMAKVATRDLEVAIEESSATATNAADIGGVVLGACFTAASPDVTATEITSVRFVPTTGALTVTVNANATAATTVRVAILQAA